jgi:hypothetical protein
VYNRDRSPEVDDVEGLAEAATKHLELLKEKDEADSSFIIEKIVGKLLNRTLDLFHFIYPLPELQIVASTASTLAEPKSGK